MQLQDSMTSSTGESVNGPTPNYGTFESPRDISSHTTITNGPSSLHIPKGPALRTDEATDVSPSSIRSLGRRDLQESQGNAKDFMLQVGSQFNGDLEINPSASMADEFSKTDLAETTLEDQLWDARIEWPKAQNRYFIPVDEFRRLITVDSVLHELQRCRNDVSKEELWGIAARVWEFAPRLFAILVCLSKGECIGNFLREELNDGDLPFVRVEGKETVPGRAVSFKFRSSRRSDKCIQCMEKWSRANMANFATNQWWMLAPIFKGSKPESKKVRHWELEDNCVLPFIEDQERSKEVNLGGQGRVWGIRIHPAHQGLYRGSNPKASQDRDRSLRKYRKLSLP